jgi:hypothetical protein
VDHIGRDVIFGSLDRDHRLRWYHELRREPPDWLVCEARRIFRNLEYTVSPKLVVKHLLLQALHYRHLAILAETTQEWSQAQRALWTGLVRCRPVGLLMEWAGRAARPHDHPCWRNRVCPWCHSRKVVKLYR